MVSLLSFSLSGSIVTRFLRYRKKPKKTDSDCWTPCSNGLWLAQADREGAVLNDTRSANVRAELRPVLLAEAQLLLEIAALDTNRDCQRISPVGERLMRLIE